MGFQNILKEKADGQSRRRIWFLFFEAIVGFKHLLTDLVKEDFHFLTKRGRHHIKLLLLNAVLHERNRINAADGRIHLKVEGALITDLEQSGDHGVKIDIAPIRIQVQVTAGRTNAAIVIVNVQSLQSGAKLFELVILIEVAKICVSRIPAYAEERMVDTVKKLVEIVRSGNLVRTR